VLYVHVTLLPALAATGELKTKPTQHSVKELRGIGIQPDVIVARADEPVADELREKIALFCDVATDAVIPATTAETIYECRSSSRRGASVTSWCESSACRNGRSPRI
jgi:CTP synthase